MNEQEFHLSTTVRQKQIFQQNLWEKVNKINILILRGAAKKIFSIFLRVYSGGLAWGSFSLSVVHKVSIRGLVEVYRGFYTYPSGVILEVYRGFIVGVNQ